MSFNFGQPLPVGPTVTTPVCKDVQVLATKLTFADFTTGGANSVKLVLPSDVSITAIRWWKKTAFSGGSVSAVVMSVGIPGTATNFVNAFDVHTPVAGTIGLITPVTNIMQDYQAGPLPDIQLLFTGTATTGNPTAGELYVTVEYVR